MMANVTLDANVPESLEKFPGESRFKYVVNARSAEEATEKVQAVYNAIEKLVADYGMTIEFERNEVLRESTSFVRSLDSEAIPA